MQADRDAIPGWQAEPTRPRSLVAHGLWWLASTVGIGLGVVAVIVLVVSGLF